MASSITPSTAGQILNENTLRTFIRCSQYYFYGGEDKLDIKTDIIKNVYEIFIANVIRKTNRDIKYLISYSVERAVKLLNLYKIYNHSEIENFKRKSIIHLGELIKMFNISTYIPVAANTVARIVLHKTPIDLEVSSILKTKEYVHLICFSPYAKLRDNRNDISNTLKLRAFKTKLNLDEKIKIHIFSVTDKNYLHYSVFKYTELCTKNNVAQALNIVSQLEKDIHRPIVPCPFNCEFKKVCNIGD